MLDFTAFVIIFYQEYSKSIWVSGNKVKGAEVTCQLLSSRNLVNSYCAPRNQWSVFSVCRSVSSLHVRMVANTKWMLRVFFFFLPLWGKSSHLMCLCLHM